MPSELGFNDLKNVLRLPGTWDLAYLKTFNGREGSMVQFDALAREAGIAFMAFNASLVAPSNYWSRYIQRTTELGIEYETGGDGDELQPLGEYSRADPIRGASSGHMIPMQDFGGAVGYTYWALRRGNMAKLRLPLRRVIDRAGNTWEKRILTRLFSPTADTVGSTGVSAPFADGGTADPDYAPLAYGGQQFDSTHTHFLVRADSADGRAAALKDGAEHLRHHGVMGPYDLVIPEADIGDWAALDGTQATFAKFIKPQRGAFLTTGVEARALVDEEVYIGLIEIERTFFRVYAATRLAANYSGIFAPKGLDNPNNPLAVRYEAGYPLGLTLIGEVKHFPLEDAQAAFTFGVGVNKREAGVLTQYKASGSYAAPAIS